MSELSGRFGLSDLLECAELARSTYYHALAHPRRPTRPELWGAAREIFSRTPSGCGHRRSRKGNCLDNAYTEGLFGHMKDEFFRGRDWDDFESFKEDLEDKEFPSKLLLSRYDSPALIPIKPHIYFRIGARKNCNDFLNKITRRTVVIRV